MCMYKMMFRKIEASIYRYGNFDELADCEEDEYKILLSMFENTLTWKDVEWLTKITKLPVVVKGILTGE